VWLSATEHGFCLWKSPPECINHCAEPPAAAVTYTGLYGIRPRRIGRGHGDGRLIMGGATDQGRVRGTGNGSWVSGRGIAKREEASPPPRDGGGGPRRAGETFSLAPLALPPPLSRTSSIRPVNDIPMI